MMFSSTNLVIEIGFVIWPLLGWQFVLADFIGGLVLIGLIAAAFRYLVPDRTIETARENVANGSQTVQYPNCGMDVDSEEIDYSKTVDSETYYSCSESCMTGWDPEEADTTLREKATSISGWQDLADKQWKEWDMLWDEIAIGFVFAGIIARFVPDSLWHSVFSGPILGMPTYMVWTAILGAVIGVMTFVCSVGNVLFGAILFTNGLPFGSVLLYIDAGLIIPSIMEAYNEYYGTTFAAVLSGLIFVGAVVTGVVLHLLFGTGVRSHQPLRRTSLRARSNSTTKRCSTRSPSFCSSSAIGCIGRPDSTRRWITGTRLQQGLKTSESDPPKSHPDSAIPTNRNTTHAHTW